MSLQLSRYCAARLADTPIEVAAATCGLGLAEARMWEADRESGEADFTAIAAKQGEKIMGREETALKSAIHDKLEEAGYVKTGPNTFTAPNCGTTIDTDPPVEPAVQHGSNNVAADQLRLFIERIERLEEEKKGTGDDIKGVYSEAKSNGYDVKTMRKVVKLRKMEPYQRMEAEALLHTYCDALGIQHSFDL